ncbi:MAG: FAD-binding protein [Thermoleophilia bacterium]|nr:FAD-binding protein [Thermoleophilia bacterium]
MSTDVSAATIAGRLAEVVGPDGVLTGDLATRIYSHDGSIVDGNCHLVVLPETTAQVSAILRIAHEARVVVVPRGSGTGLTGGALPLAGGLVVSLARMREIAEVDLANACVWVEPGVLNLDVSTAVAPHGLFYAPDPSSQQACSIGGNVATNAGGPHCLAYGVTVQHVLGVELVLPDGEVVVLGGLAPDPPGYDLRGLVVGAEGTVGVVTRILLRLTPLPALVRTMLLDFVTVREASTVVQAIIAAGVIPAAMEMMDRNMAVAVEEFVHAGLPTDAAALLLVEVDGTPAEVAAADEVVQRVATAGGVRTIRVAQDDEERALLWKARKNAFGAVARVKPSYYLHDCVVPRTKLVAIMDVIGEIAERENVICLNVFHAGDGNLHPIIAFDRSDPDEFERAMRAGDAIVRACVAMGGTLSGEHGIGVEKRDYMPLVFTDDDLEAQACLRRAFDPAGRMNPAKVLPTGTRCGEVGIADRQIPEGTWI